MTVLKPDIKSFYLKLKLPTICIKTVPSVMMMNKNSCKNTEDNWKKSKPKSINFNAIWENVKLNYKNTTKALLLLKLNWFNLKRKENKSEFDAKKSNQTLKSLLTLRLKLKAEFNGWSNKSKESINNAKALRLIMKNLKPNWKL